MLNENLNYSLCKCTRQEKNKIYTTLCYNYDVWSNSQISCRDSAEVALAFVGGGDSSEDAK